MRQIWISTATVRWRAFPQRHDHIRRNTMLRLIAGISVMAGTENPKDCAVAATASRSRRPELWGNSRRLQSLRPIGHLSNLTLIRPVSRINPSFAGVGAVKPVIAKTSRRTSRIKSRLRSVAGAYCVRRSSSSRILGAPSQDSLRSKRRRQPGVDRGLPLRSTNAARTPPIVSHCPWRWSS